MALNPDIAAAIEHVEKFLDQGDWRARLAVHRGALLEPVLAEAQIDIPELFTTLEQDGLLTSFAAYVDEAFLSARLRPDDANALDAYLKRRGWQESPRARAYLEGVRDATPAVWEVRSTEPGAWVEVCDRLGDGSVVRLVERSASTMLQRYDRIVARVVRIRDIHMLTGGVLMLTHDVAESLEAKLRRMLKSGKSTRESVTAICVQFWTVAVLRHRARRVPDLRTTHGEPLMSWTHPAVVRARGHCSGSPAATRRRRPARLGAHGLRWGRTNRLDVVRGRGTTAEALKAIHGTISTPLTSRSRTQ